MKMRKTMALILAVIMVAALFAGCQLFGKKPDYPNQVIMGTTTQPNGVIPVFWGNNATDADARELTHGGATIVYTHEDGYVVNTAVVKDWSSELNADGSKTFTFELKKGLKWSNDVEITAKDYVGALLVFSHPTLAVDMEAQYADLGYYFDGYNAFFDKETDVFSGVRLLDEYKFAVTLDAQYLPFYFELAYVSAAPEYMEGWLPGYTYADDGEGAYIVGDMSVDAISESIDNFYNNMDVFCGPYVCSSYDAATTTYTFDLNKNYPGDLKGKKPKIERIIIKMVAQETQMDELRTGSIDILTNVADGAAIVAGLDMVDEGILDYSTYDRNGYGHITFKCDFGPTQFKEVRHAVGYLLNRPEFARIFTEGFGSVVHGPYGTGMAMYASSVKELEERLNPYNYSLDAAIASLEAGGWTLDADGKPYSGSGIRHKEVDGEIMPLVIEWASSENNDVSDLIATMLAQNPDVAAAGIQINQTVMTFAELLYEHYYLTNESFYGMFNLATNFTPVYNQTFYYEPGGANNNNQYPDDDLYTLAQDMVKVDPEDYDTFLTLWLDFVDLWNEQLPSIPLYSNQYFDFYSPNIEDYVIPSAYLDFTSAITDAKVAGY